MATIIGYLRTDADPRCPISLDSLKKLEKAGYTYLAEDGIADAIGGLEISTVPRSEVLRDAHVIYCSTPLSAEEMSALSGDKVLISFYAPYEEAIDPNHFPSDGVSAYSMDMIPRTTLAQSMDVLSSMASLAGYQAVLLAASKLPRYFPMLMTAAGTIRPANVLVIGAGVAGLQAIATAKRLGARVEAFDVRDAVRDEVQSLGAKFVEVEGATDDIAAGGYAVQQTPEYLRKQKEAIAAAVKKADAVITTAQLRGRPAPTLVTEEMVKTMKPGSVIIDMASSSGGNCECSADTQHVQRHGVHIIGDSQLYLQTLQDASDLLANNIANYASIFLDEEGKLLLNSENEILQKSIVFPQSDSQ